MSQQTSDPRIRPIDLSGLPPESVDIDRRSELSVLAQLFRQFHGAGRDVADFAGPTMPPTHFYMQGWRDAWNTAAQILDWARETDVEQSAELINDISGPVMALIESIVKTSKRSYQAGREKGNGIK